VKWLLHLYRFWPLYVAAALALTGAGLYVHHSIYESGYAASEAKWQPLFAKAERELAAANARTKAKETESTLAVAESQRRIDETNEALRVRSADYDSRLRSISMRYAAARASCQQVPAVPGGPSEASGTTESEQRAAEIGSAIARVGADCESDAARLAEWQRWYTEQRVIFDRH